MPKATSASSSSSVAAAASGPFQNAHVLRRNQACHQCRKRKLKCDAKRPCSTCVRSHTYAVAHAPAGTQLPPHPECTFDDVSEANTPEPHDPPKNRLERLESRINELEALLSEKDKALRSSTTPNPPSTSSSSNGQYTFPHALTNGIPSLPSNGYSLPSSNGHPITDSPLSDLTAPLATFTNGHSNGQSALENLAGVASLMDSPSGSSPAALSASAASRSPPIAIQTNGVETAGEYGTYPTDLFFLSWPPNLPPPDLLKHLVEAALTYNSHVSLMFHPPTFLTSLSFPPSHPRFPSPAVLHIMCAVGSMYTAAVDKIPHPTSSDFSPWEIFVEKYRLTENRPEAFPELQAKYAKECIETMRALGVNLFQCLQAQILLAWWYWANAKWTDAFMAVAQSLRMAIPCGINVCPPFHSISESIRPPSLLAPATTVLEDETRRNTFWLAYALERTHACGNGWAMMLDDQDISQLLPVRREDFENGTLVPPSERQWSHDCNLLTHNPPQQTDAFILFIKSTILLSRVKQFNLRFRSKYHARDPSMLPSDDSFHRAPGAPIDARESPAFKELDRLSVEFRQRFPPHLRNPVSGNSVDPYLYTACMTPYFSQIILHEPHASVGRKTCISSCRLLTGARGILDLIYAACSTNYDTSLLGLFSTICWFMAGRVLVRFLRSAIDSISEENCATLQSEIEYIRSMLAAVGERVPLAHRYAKMLYDFLIKTCGAEWANPAPVVLGPRRDFPVMPDNTNMYDDVILNSLMMHGTGRMAPLDIPEFV